MWWEGDQLELAVAADGRGDVDHAGAHEEGGPFALVGQSVQALLIEQGFEVTVVKDATAGPKLPEGDGYLAALVNYRLVANDLWTTDEVVRQLGQKV